MRSQNIPSHKLLKPDVRSICISDAILRLVSKGLFACCKASFTSVFLKSQFHNPRLISFVAYLRNNGATHMFNLIVDVLYSLRRILGIYG